MKLVLLIQFMVLDYYGRDLNKQQFDLLNVNNWKGSNLLGFALMQVRDELKAL